MIFFSYPLWFLLFCVLTGIIYAGILYYKNNSFNQENQMPKWLKPLLFIARALAVFFISILLLSPFIKNRNTDEFKPIIAILTDRSESVRNTLGKDTSLLNEKIKLLETKLSNRFEVKRFSVADKIEEDTDLNFDGKATDLSSAFEYINDQFYNRNLGAVILASDGIYNKGINPVYSVQNASYKIHSVFFGDTTFKKDLKISGLFFNKTVFLNDLLGVRLDVDATFLNGKNSTLGVSRIENGKAIPTSIQKNININSNNSNQQFEFSLPADKTGVLHYRVTAKPIEGEYTTKNNSRDIFFEVLDARQKILMLANAPHPDLSAFKSAIENNKNYSVDVEMADNFSKSLNDYSLIILHGLPSSKHSLTNIWDKIKSQNKSALFVISSQTNLNTLPNFQNLLSIKSGQKTNQVSTKFNTNFPLFTINNDIPKAIQKLAPLTVPFGEYKTSPGAQVLIWQRVNNVDTDFPLLLFNENNEQKIGILCGEGYWQWRLYDFLQNKNMNSSNEVIQKSIQYLSVKTDKRPFVITMPKSIFSDNDRISFEGRLRNASGEMINTSEVKITIKNDQGKQFEYKMERTESSYKLDAGFLPSGSYSYSSSTSVGTNSYQFNGKFSVSPIQLEDLSTRADFQLMTQLASQHRGVALSLNNIDLLAENLLNDNDLKPILMDKYTTDSAINLKWIFFLFLGLLAGEWFLRKYYGSY